MRSKLLQILLIVGILWISWMAMMLIHETGHVLGAIATGGTVRQVVWHPAILSRTDVQPNPHPRIEVWAGPLFGCLLPLLGAAMLGRLHVRSAYLFWVVAGFCLIANGAYIGIGALDPVGDARELVRLGAPRWVLGSFGIATAMSGLWIWHRISPRLGFGPTSRPIETRHAWACTAVALLFTILGFTFGHRGV